MVKLNKKISASKKQEVTEKKPEAKKQVEEEELEEVSDGSFDSGEEFEEIDESVEEIEDDDSEEDEDDDELEVEEGSLAVKNDEMKKLSQAIKGRNKQISNDKQVSAPKVAEPRVIYLGRVPYGFFEKAMKGFFSQFGVVLKVRISRNKKTGKSRGYGFVEFKEARVAKIVQETMNGYLLSGRKIVCALIPPEKVHPLTFKKDKKRGRIPWKRIAVQQHNKAKDSKAVEKIVTRLQKKEKAKRKKLEQLGIDYDFPGYAAQTLQKPKKIKLNQ